MKFIVKECPKCHAPIEEQSRFCSHCGTAVLLDDEATRSKYTYQKVDDARIREADVKEKIRLKELEIEHMKLQDEIHQRKQTLQMRLALVISFFAVLLVLLLMYAFVKNQLGLPDDTYAVLAFFMIIAMCIILPFVFRRQK